MNASEQHITPIESGSAGTFMARKISRLDFLRQISMLMGLVAVGCSPVRVVLKAYPKKYEEDPELMDRFLRSFVVTVIPGAPFDEPNLVRMYTDEHYPFHPYCGFFCSDLARRSKEMYGTDLFHLLSDDQRGKVIEDGLNGDAVVARLFRAAILMAQVSYYAGIYDDEKGCPLIDFHGSNSGFTNEEMSYADCSSMLARETTQDGNYS